MPLTLNILLLVLKTLNGAYAYSCGQMKGTAHFTYIMPEYCFRMESEKVRPNEQLKITLSQTFLFALFSYVPCNMSLLNKYFCSSFDSDIFLSFALSLSQSLIHSFYFAFHSKKNANNSASMIKINQNGMIKMCTVWRRNVIFSFLFSIYLSSELRALLKPTHFWAKNNSVWVSVRLFYCLFCLSRNMMSKM